MKPGTGGVVARVRLPGGSAAVLRQDPQTGHRQEQERRPSFLESVVTIGFIAAHILFFIM